MCKHISKVCKWATHALASKCKSTWWWTQGRSVHCTHVFTNLLTGHNTHILCWILPIDYYEIIFDLIKGVEARREEYIQWHSPYIICRAQDGLKVFCGYVLSLHGLTDLPDSLKLVYINCFTHSFNIMNEFNFLMTTFD